MKHVFKVVLDTNVLISSQSSNPKSPSREIIDRWERKEFQLLYSHDVLLEYTEKLLERGVPKEKIVRFVRSLKKGATNIFIKFYHHHSEKYPNDEDDIAFILCADNGNASHLVSYDAHLLDIKHQHSFKICKPVEFLKELRYQLKQ